jgi:predicted kinase
MDEERAMLIMLGGLPGVGKSAVARALARELSAVHVRVDTIERAIVGSGCREDDVGAAGYLVGQALAADNLRLGLMVVADAVNALEIARRGWREAARSAGSPILEVELVCSDVKVHRRRAETRQPDIPGLVLPSWESVIARARDPWESADLSLDTASQSVAQAVAAIVRRLPAPRHSQA